MNINIAGFKYSFEGDYGSIQCVYKMWFGAHYFIWKCKALHQSVKHITDDIQRKKLKVSDTDLLVKIVRHITRNRVTLMRVELIKKCDTPSELLITEYDQLQAAKKDPLCLNMSFEPYIPAWIPVEALQALDKHKADIIAAKKKKRKKKPAIKIKLNAKSTVKTKAAGNAKAGAKGRGRR